MSIRFVTQANRFRRFPPTLDVREEVECVGMMVRSVETRKRDDGQDVSSRRVLAIYASFTESGVEQRSNVDSENDDVLATELRSRTV